MICFPRRHSALNRGESTSANFQPAAGLYKITKTTRSYRWPRYGRFMQEPRTLVAARELFRCDKLRRPLLQKKKKKKRKKKERGEETSSVEKVEREADGKEAFARRNTGNEREGEIRERERVAGSRKEKKERERGRRRKLRGSNHRRILWDHNSGCCLVPSCRSLEGLVPSPRSHSKPLGRPDAFYR